MKNLIPFIVILFALFTISSCTKVEKFENEQTLKKAGVLKSDPIDISIYPDDNALVWPGSDGCGLAIYDLFGGQTIHMGTVSVISFESDLYVKYELNDESNCMITETHLFVGDINDMVTGKNGNPKIGHFPFKWEGAGSDVVIMKIPGKAGCFSIAAHAVVNCGNVEETAWAKSGNIFALKSSVEISDEVFKPVITGVPGSWCSNFTPVTLYQALNEGIIELVYYYNGITSYGEVAVDIVDGFVRFIVTSDFGDVSYSHLFLGSFDSWYSIDQCDHWTEVSFIQNNVRAQQHVFEFPVSLLDVVSFDLPGNAWGWYIDKYCMGGC